VIWHGLQAADKRFSVDSALSQETVKAFLLGEDYDNLFRAGLKAIEASSKRVKRF
jgi:hypothetical protein